MDYTPKELENLAKMDSLLARLQVCAAVRVEAIERMQIATTGLEMQRQTRAIKMVADLVVDLHSPPRPPKLRPSRKAKPEAEAPTTSPTSSALDSFSSTLDDLLKRLPPAQPKPAKTTLRPQRAALLQALEVKGFDHPSPPHVSHGVKRQRTYSVRQRWAREVAPACRAEALAKAEGYESPLISGVSAAEYISASARAEGRRGDVDASSEPETLEDLRIEATRDAIELVDKATHACARWAGIWPDSARFVEADTTWRRHTLTAIPALDLTANTDISLPIRQEILNRANAVARAYGRQHGIGLDTCQYREHSQDLWKLSTNLGTRRCHPAPGETPSPDCLPWWIVRKPPPSQPT